MMHANSRTWRKPKSVLIVDDHPVVRRGVRALVEGSPGLEVVGEAGNGFDAIEAAAATVPDIVVMDLSMPHLGGLETIAELRRQLPEVEVLIFSLHQSEHFLEQATGAGARGYVCKAESDHLVPALEAVARREAYFSPSVGERLVGQSDEEAWDRRPLTLRERQVVKFVAEGFSNKEIARKLNISVKTAETHRSAAMRKTGTNSATGLTLYAARNGLVEL
jgi:DNA-binding NarL/FixJ family response regulator